MSWGDYGRMLKHGRPCGFGSNPGSRMRFTAGKLVFVSAERCTIECIPCTKVPELVQKYISLTSRKALYGHWLRPFAVLPHRRRWVLKGCLTGFRFSASFISKQNAARNIRPSACANRFNVTSAIQHPLTLQSQWTPICHKWEG